jgi:predicted RNA-binding protein YlxR (DUF448 family)
VQQGVLRLVKLFAVMYAPGERGLFTAAARSFSLPPHEVSASLASLETALWISRDSDIPTSLDVQLEAIPLGPDDLTRWDELVQNVATDDLMRAQLHNGSGSYYWSVRAPRARELRSRRSALLSALGHFNSVATLMGVGDLIWRSGALNNVSLVYSDLARLETTREGRGEWLRRAVQAVEEAVHIYGELGVQGALAMSLNNASNGYSDLAGLETTREGRGEWLRKAVEAVEEAVRINRQLGAQGDLATSLHNVANHYSGLAELETMREGRCEWLRKAVEAVEEAVRIYRELGVQADLAKSLGVSSRIRGKMAENANDPDAALEDLRASRSAIGEAVELFREGGNATYFLQALQAVVMSDLSLAQAGDELEEAAVRSACATGLELARSMQDEERSAFFNRILGDTG